MKMKSKRALVWLIPLIYLLAGLGIIILLVIFAYKISEGLSAVTSFFSKWWLWIIIGIFVFIFRDIVAGVLRFILGKIGIRI